MKSRKPVDKVLAKHLTAKRNELIWALNAQDYNNAEIGRIFNIERSTVLRIIRKKPAKWSSPWFKITKI